MDHDATFSRQYDRVAEAADRSPEDQAIRRATELEQALLSSARLGVAVYDRELRCQLWNRCFVELTGVPTEQALGKPLSSLAAWQRGRLAASALLEQALRGTVSSTGPVLIGAADSTRPRWIDVTYEPLRDPHGQITGVLALGQEVTDQILGEEEHRTVEQNFRNLAEQLPDGVAIFKGRDTRYVSQRLLQLVGYEDPAELLDRAIIETLFAPRDQAAISALCQQLQAGGNPLPPWQGVMVRRDGRECAVECRLSPTIFDHQTAHLIVVRERSPSDRFETPPSRLAQEHEQQADLSAALEQVHGLSRKLIAAQEAQTRRLSRELHDDVGQLITALKLYLDRLQPAVVNETERDTLDTARQIAVELVERVRRLSMDLRPTVLDDLGLVPALRWQFERLQKLTGVRVNLLSRGIERRFAEDIEIAVFRIVQEALCNVIRHARVSEVAVRLWCDGLKLGAQIEDRGVGFAVDLALSTGDALGLSNMCERARQLDGECVIESVPGRGTRITIELPFADTESQKKESHSS